MHSQQPTANSQQPTANNDYGRFKFGLIVLPLAIITALAGFPGSAFAQVSARKTTHAVLNSHPSYQSITVLTGDSQTVHSTLRKIDPLPGVGDPPPPPTNSQPAKVKLQAFDVNTHSHQATIILSNGFKVVLDGQRQTITIANGRHTKTVSLDKALLKWAKGNTALANQRKQKLLKILNIKINNARLAAIDSASPDSYLTPSTRSGFVPNSTYVHTNLINLPPMTVIGSPLPRFSCWATFSCFYNPLPRQSWQPDNVHYGFWSQGGHAAPPSDTPKHTADYNYWNRWRKDHCDQAKSEWVNADVGAAALGALLSVPVVGWLGAAVAAVGVVVIGVQATMDERVCNSSYPGYGKW